MANYAYPIDPDWSHQEMADVIRFLNLVEQAYEAQVAAQAVLETYRDFKKVVRSIGEEKQMDRDFKAVSGYSLYRVIQQAKQAPNQKFTMK